MSALSMMLIIGMLSLVVDLGWSYFIKKKAQLAADSAALASALQAFANVGGVTTFTCGTNVTCQAITPCSNPVANPPVNNIDNGCLYAMQNGYTTGGRQSVTMQANTTTPAPTVPGVFVDYWVTTRVTETPLNFFAMLAGPRSVAARATAAVIDSPASGTFYALNRQNDASPFGTGVDLSLQGGGSLNVAGALLMASTANNSVYGTYAGQTGGSSFVTSMDTRIRGGGGVDNPTNWTPPPKNGYSDGSNFMDPMRGKGQPPAPAPYASGGPPLVPVPGGTVPPGTLTPGRYYAVGNNGKATGNTLKFSGNYTFTAGPSGFGDYVFFGGANFTNPGSVITFAPGRYIFAGAAKGGAVFAMSNGVTLQDNTPLDATGNITANTDAGEIFIFTDTNYPGLEVPSEVQNLGLAFGSADLQMGNDAQSVVILHGLNAQSSALPAGLKGFAPTVFWQDQRNSGVLYDSTGNIDTKSCGAGYTIDSPCQNTNPNIDPLMNLQAYPNFHLFGVIYQPRGGSMNFQAHGTISNPLLIVTGALSCQGSPVYLQALTNPFIIRQVTLIE